MKQAWETCHSTKGIQVHNCSSCYRSKHGWKSAVPHAAPQTATETLSQNNLVSRPNLDPMGIEVLYAKVKTPAQKISSQVISFNRCHLEKIQRSAVWGLCLPWNLQHPWPLARKGLRPVVKNTPLYHLANLYKIFIKIAFPFLFHYKLKKIFWSKKFKMYTSSQTDKDRKSNIRKKISRHARVASQSRKTWTPPEVRSVEYTWRRRPC